MKKILFSLSGMLFLCAPTLASSLPVCGSAEDTWLGACSPVMTQDIENLPTIKYIGASTPAPSASANLPVMKSLPISTATPTVTVQPTATAVPTLTPMATVKPMFTVTPVASVGPKSMPVATIKPISTVTPKPTPTIFPRTKDDTMVTWEMLSTSEKKLAYPVQSTPRTEISSIIERKDPKEYSLFEKALEKELAIDFSLPNVSLTRAKAVEAILLTKNSELLTPAPKEVIFPDVLASSPSSPFIKTLKVQGAIDGYDDGLFRSQAPINLAESYKMVSISFGMSSADEEKKGKDWYLPFKEDVRQSKILPELLAKNDATLPTPKEFSRFIWESAIKK